MVKGVTIRKSKSNKIKGRILGWQVIAEHLLDERGHCRRDDIPYEADVREAGGGDKHVGHAVVGPRDAPDQEAVCGLEREAGYRPQGAVQAHTRNKVEQKVKIQRFIPDA